MFFSILQSENVCFISGENPRELRQLHITTAGSIIGVGAEQHSAMTNDETKHSLFLSAHKVSKTFQI